jgi:hypothetical protein
LLGGIISSRRLASNNIVAPKRAVLLSLRAETGASLPGMASSGSVVRPCPCRPSQRYLSFQRLRVVLIARAIDEGEHLEMLFANFVFAFARHILVMP